MSISCKFTDSKGDLKEFFKYYGKSIRGRIFPEKCQKTGVIRVTLVASGQYVYFANEDVLTEWYKSILR